MPENIEIKARIQDRGKTLDLIRDLCPDPPEILIQTDIFFNCTLGRLKLRLFDDGKGELIFYKRIDEHGPKMSHYNIVQIDKPENLLQVLSSAYGIRGTIKKTRHLTWVGQTRIHLDQVENLGNFLELEVVMRPLQSHTEGIDIARDLCQKLDIHDDHLIDVAYIDLLEKKG